MIKVAIHDKYFRERRWDFIGRMLEVAKQKSKAEKLNIPCVYQSTEISKPDDKEMRWIEDLHNVAMANNHKYHIITIDESLTHMTSDDDDYAEKINNSLFANIAKPVPERSSL